MNRFRIIKISSIFDTIRILEILKIGMNMNDLWAFKVFKLLLLKNEGKDCYGFAIEKNNKICGGILTFFQGKYKDNLGNFRDIYNLSTFYVNENMRGIASIALIKELINFFEDCILTNYTANNQVQKILFSLGFKPMKSFDSRFNSFSLKTFLGFKTRNIQNIKNVNFKYLANFIPNIKNYRGMISLKNYSLNLEMIGIISHKKIGFLRIPFFVILWSSDEIDLFQNLNEIKNYLFYKYFCLGVQIFSKKINISNNLNNSVRKNYFLIKSPFKINYIPPLGTEFEAIL